MTDVVIYAICAVGAFAALWKALQARVSHARSSLLYMAGALGFFALAVAALTPTTLRAAAHIEPIPNLTRLVGNSLLALGLLCVHGTLSHLVGDDSADRGRSQRRLALACFVSLILMTILMVNSGTEFTIDFVAVYGGKPAVAAYLCVVLGFIVVALVPTIRLAWWLYGRVRGLLKASVLALFAAQITGLLWACWKLTMTLLNALASVSTAIEGPVSLAVGSISAALFVLSVLIIALRSALIAPSRAWQAWRTWRALEPLWIQMTQAMPHVVLPVQMGRWSQLRRIRIALYRRVIEISDATLSLAPWVHPDTATRTRKVARDFGIEDPSEIPILTTAASIATAIDAHAAGNPGSDPPPTASRGVELSGPQDAAAALRLAMAMDSPVVAVVRAWVRHRSPAAAQDDAMMSLT